MEPRYLMAVEEFIPRTNVDDLLAAAMQLDSLNPVETTHALLDTKRSIAWMERYVLPTSEFWEWSTDRIKFDSRTALTVRLIGTGWIVEVSSTVPCTVEELGGEEKRLIELLDRLTGHIPLEAILRLKSGGWSQEELSEVAEAITLHGFQCESLGDKLEIADLEMTISTQPGERLRCHHVSRATAQKVSEILLVIKQYANRKFEGASWCAYQRRRLTLVHKKANNGFSEADLRFILHPEDGVKGDVIAGNVLDTEGEVGRLAIFRTKYHEGKIHPRAMLAASRDLDESSYEELSSYIYYLWNTHSNRIWLYLVFEDLYSYIGKLRASRQYDDPMLPQYWQSLLNLDNTVAELKTQERVDQGNYQSYRPPHEKYQETKYEAQGITQDATPITWLHDFLIDSTASELHENPLEKASTLLEGAGKQMKDSVALFTETINIRIQRALHVIQLIFIIAAAAQVLAIVPIGNIIAEYLTENFASVGWWRAALSWLDEHTAGQSRDILTGLANLFGLIVLTTLGILTLRALRVRALIERIIS